MASMLNRIEKIADELKMNYLQFPREMCNIASDTLSKRLGLYMVTGQVYNPKNGNPIACHTWNYDLKRQLYIDITLHQFDELKGLGPIIIVPKHSKISKLIYSIPDHHWKV
jgi:hypothetical protein